jgi:hypothetical protein
VLLSPTCHECTEGEYKYRATQSRLRRGMEVGGNWHDLAALPSERNTGIHWTRGWVGPRAEVDVLGGGHWVINCVLTARYGRHMD